MTMSQLDYPQVLKTAFNDATGKLRVEGNWVPASDVTGSGTINGNGQTVVANLQGTSTYVLNITGTWVATLQFEGSVDNATTYFSINSTPILGGTDVTSTTTNGQWSIACAGLTNIRIRSSAYTSGTANITYNASIAGNGTEVTSPIASGFKTTANIQDSTGLPLMANSQKELLVAVSDPTTGNSAAVTAFHNTDNQAFGGTTYGLFTGGVAQLKNAVNNLDRQAETGPDNISALGVATGTQQLASPLTISGGGTVSAGATSITITPASQLKQTNRGANAWISIGSILTLEPGTTNQENVVVTSINYSTGILNISGLGNGGSNTGFKFTHTASYTINSFSYNQARDATAPDGTNGAGFSAGATYLFNNTLNSGNGGWEAERSFSGELSGATGTGSAIATEYEDTAGGPVLASGLASGLRLQAGQNLLGKGKLAKTITSTLVGDSNLVFANAAATNLVLAGHAIQLSGSGTLETVYTTSTWTPGSSATVPLQSPVVNASQTTATYDINSANGPGLNGFLPHGIGIEEEALYNPVDGLYYVERSATQDAVSGSNIVLENAALYNGSTFDRQRSVSGDAMTATGLEAATDLLYNGSTFDRARSVSGDSMSATGIEAATDMLYNGASYDRPRSATGDAMATTGVPAEAAMLWNGSSFDRERNAKGDTFGTAIGDARGPGDQGCESEVSYGYGYNGASWDRIRSVNTGQLVTTLKDTSGNAPTTSTQGSKIGLNASDLGYSSANAPVLNNYASTSVTSAAYVQMVASTTSDCQEIEIFDSSGQSLYLATGAAASEVNQIIITPGGNGRVKLRIASGTRISLKATSTSATTGTLIINFYG